MAGEPKKLVAGNNSQTIMVPSADLGELAKLQKIFEDTNKAPPPQPTVRKSLFS